MPHTFYHPLVNTKILLKIFPSFSLSYFLANFVFLNNYKNQQQQEKPTTRIKNLKKKKKKKKMSSSSVLSSQSVIITTAMAVSGAVILLSLSRIKNLPFIQQLPTSPNSSSLRSCLSSERLKGEKKDKKKKKKRVKFADNVKEEKVTEGKKKQSTVEVLRAKKVTEFRKLPANRAALYHGILRDRIQRIESY